MNPEQLSEVVQKLAYWVFDFESVFLTVRH